MNKKILFFVVGAMVMLLGDYITAYLDEGVTIYLLGDAMSVTGFVLLFMGIDKK